MLHRKAHAMIQKQQLIFSRHSSLRLVRKSLAAHSQRSGKAQSFFQGVYTTYGLYHDHDHHDHDHDHDPYVAEKGDFHTRRDEMAGVKCESIGHQVAEFVD